VLNWIGKLLFIIGTLNVNVSVIDEDEILNPFIKFFDFSTSNYVNSTYFNVHEILFFSFINTILATVPTSFAYILISFSSFSNPNPDITDTGVDPFIPLILTDKESLQTIFGSLKILNFYSFIPLTFRYIFDFDLIV